MNEVISHLASARLGGAKVHPNDDVNKCIWSQLAWAPETDVRAILRDYSSYFIGANLADPLTEGLLALERNWRGALATNDGVEETLARFQSMERAATPEETARIKAMIDQAVADGVDVINYSVSGSQTNLLDPVEVLARCRPVPGDRTLQRPEGDLLHHREHAHQVGFLSVEHSTRDTVALVPSGACVTLHVSQGPYPSRRSRRCFGCMSSEHT